MMEESEDSKAVYTKLNGTGGSSEYGTDNGQNGHKGISNGPTSSSSKTSPHGDNDADSGKSSRKSSSRGSVESGDEEETEGLQEQPEAAPMSDRRKRLAFLMEMLLVFAVYLPYALLAPFFTTKANDMDLSPLQIGILLAVFAGVSSIFSILIGQFLPQIGPKFAFISGAFLIAGCSILMAPQIDLSPGTQYFWFTFFTFIIWSVGHAAANTSCTAMISYYFPGNEAILFGVMESFIGLGFLLSGPIGSVLYKAGGYTLPFYIYGGFLLLLVVINFFVVPSYNAPIREKTSFFTLLSIPSVWTTCLTLTITFAMIGVITVGLAVQLTDRYEVKDENTGFFWILSGITKTITSTLVGTLTNKLVGYNSAAARLILIGGQVIGCISLVMIGPSGSLGKAQALSMVCIGLGLEGVVKSCVIVPALVDVTVTARWSGLPDNFGTQSVIAGLFWGAFSFGTFLGPILGGSLIDAFGFSGACHIGSVIFLVMAAILSTYLLWEYRCGLGRREPFRLFHISGSDVSKDSIPLVSSK